MTFDPVTAKPAGNTPFTFDASTARPADVQPPAPAGASRTGFTFDASTARPADVQSPAALAAVAIKYTADKTPEDTAEVLRLRKRHPAPFDVLYENLRDVRLQEAVAKADERLRTSPKLAEYIGKRPEIAPLVRDDVPVLTKIARAVNEWATNATTGWKQAGLQDEMADLLFAEATGPVLDEPRAARLEALQRQQEALQRAQGKGVLAESARDQGYSARQFLSSTYAALWGIGSGGVAGAAAGSVLPGVGTVAGGTAGMVAGGLVASANYSYMRETAFAYDELRRLRDINGQPLPRELAQLGAQGVGVVNSIIEVASDVAIAKLIPGVRDVVGRAFGKQAAKELVKDQLKAALADPARRSLVVEGLRGMLATASVEGLEEFLQGLVGAGAREAVQAVSGMEFKPDSLPDDLRQAATEAFQAFRGTALTLGVGVGGAQIVSLYRAQQQATAVQAALDNSARLQEALQVSGQAKSRSLAPDEFREVVGSVTEGRAVYVDAEVLAQLPQEVLEQLPQRTRDELAVAADIGGAVRLDLADVLTVAPGTPLEQTVVEYGRSSPEAFTKAEVENSEFLVANLRNDAQRIIEQAQDTEAARAEYTALRDEYAQQLIATGRYSEAVSRGMAEFIASFYTVYAKRAGMSVAQMRAKYPLRVVAVPSQPRSGAYVDDTIGGVIDWLRDNASQLPAGPLTRSEWAAALEDTLPEAATALRDAGLLDGDERPMSLDELLDEVAVAAPRGAYAQPVSTRVPWASGRNAAKAENPLTARLRVGLEAFKDVPDALQKATDRLVTYPNWPSKWRVKSAHARAERFIEYVVENLLWLHDQVPAEIRARSKKWYDGAHVIANVFAGRYGITLSQAAAVLAVNSPQTEWFTNVSRAERILDIWFTKQDAPWSAEMDAVANAILGKEKYAEDLAQIRGKTLRDLDGNSALQAMWLRVYDQAHNNRSFRIVTPEGAFGDYVKTQAGVNAIATWANFSHIAKSIEILRDGSIENVSLQLGNEHKVRSFYNNIFAPNDPVGDVTIDTHAVAAALLRPLSGDSIEVTHNLGGGVSNALKGLSGTYGIYAEAYRRAAAARGLLPREMQSITWEAVRGLFAEGFKSSKGAQAVEDVWAEFKRGKVSLDKAREQVLALTGGVNEPNWWQSDRRPPTTTWSSSYGGELLEFRVPGPVADAVAGGDQARSGAGGGGVRGREGSDQGRGLAPLEGAPNVRGAAGPDPGLVAVAEQYARDNGFELKRQAVYVAIDEDRARRIAQAYDAMPHAPSDPQVREAYADLNRQTMAQYRALEAAGYRFWFIDSSNDPYSGNPWNAMRDLRATKSMGVFPTEDGFGSGATDLNVEDSPLLADTGLRWPYGSPDGPLKRVLANDLFRAVHDAFGHGLEGAGFRAQGEENAWQAHVRLYRGPAVGALTSETRGQNSWLNYGPYGEKNRTAKVEDTVFADQKTGLMPEWTWTEGRAPDMPDSPPVLEQAADRVIAESTYTDQRGDAYDVQVIARAYGAQQAIMVEARQNGQRRGFVDFSVRDDGVLTSENTLVAPAYRKRGLAEAMYRAAREAGFDIAPGRVQTDAGLAMVERLQAKGLINREAIGPRFRAGDLELAQSRNATETAEFRRWFGDSAVVDENGRPLVVYHGTQRAADGITVFGASSGYAGQASAGASWFTASPDEASQYANWVNGAGNPTVYPVYLSIQRPATLADVDEAVAAVNQAAEAEFRAQTSGIDESTADGAARVSDALERYAPAPSQPEEATYDPRVVAELKRRGFDGIVYGPGVVGEAAAYVVFSPEQVKSAIANAGTFDPANASILMSRDGRRGPRGTFNPATLELVLRESADLSTFFHESGHFFLEVLADLASQPGAPQQIVDDFGTVMRWFGVDAQRWTSMTLDEKRPYHERFAESIEQYVMEGRVSNPELLPLMRRFAAWLKSVYDSIRKFLATRPDAQRMPLNDDVRRVMDRMLSTDEQIAAAEAEAGMPFDEEATSQAQERLRARSMRDLRLIVKTRDKIIAKRKREARKIEQRIREEVTAEVDAMPEFRAKAALEEAERAHEADPKSADFNAAAIADAFGFRSVEQMYAAIDRVGDRQELIDGRTQQRMLEEHGELIDERAIKDAANAEIHNEARARALATELRAQQEMLDVRIDTGRVNARGARITTSALVAAGEKFAAQILASTPIDDLRATAWKHTLAERKAAQRWQQATAAGDTVAAVRAKRDQFLHNAAARAATQAREDLRKGLEFFKRVLKGNDEKVVEKGRDPALVNAARAVLGAYGLNTPTTKRADKYLELVAQYDPDTAAMLQDLVRDAVDQAQPITALTLEQFVALHDLVRQIWKLAKETRQLEIGGKKVEIDAVAAELQARMEVLGIPDEIPGERSAITPSQRRKAWLLHDAPALLRRVEQWAEAKDGGFGGPFLRFIFQPVKEAADRFRAERAQRRAQLTALFEQYRDLFEAREPIDAPELGYTFGADPHVPAMSELLHALLHTGNESNKRKLLVGRAWGFYDAQTKTLDTTRWDAFIKRMHDDGVLTQRHWDFVQGVWDLLEDMKPAAQETHRRVYGRFFDEVTAEPVVTPFGAYRGGYVPAQIDPRLVKDGALKQNIETENSSASFIFPATPRGFTMSRVESYMRPLLLDLRSFGMHVDKVLLFTHLQPAITQTQRLLRHRAVSTPLNRIDGAAINAMLIPWLNRAARQQVETPAVADAGLSRMVSTLRARTGMGLMFLNVSNALQQVTAFSTALVKVSPLRMLRSAVEYLRHPVELTHEVWDRSTAMRDRAKNEVAVLSDTMNQILIDPTLRERGEEFLRKHAYVLQTAVDSVTSVITWRAAYNQAIEQGMQHDDAVRFADGTVRQTHGSTLPEDVSRFETGPAFARLFTQFMNYFNMLGNTASTAIINALRDGGVAGAGRAAYAALVVVLAPLWVAEAIALAMRGGPDDDDGDGQTLQEWLLAVFGFGTAKGLTAMVPGVNVIAQPVIGSFTAMPIDDRFSLSPTIGVLERVVSGNVKTLQDALDEDKEVKWQRAIRDGASAITLLTGLPASTIARPLGYAAGVAQGTIEPAGLADAARGLVTGTASPESRRP